MKKISVSQVGAIISAVSNFQYSIKPDLRGFIIIRYTSKFNKFFNIEGDKYLVDLIEDNSVELMSFGSDIKLNYLSYMKYCERGFNDNPMEDDMLDLLNAATGVAEEANEIMGVVRKFVFHNKPFSLEDFASEAGDLTWFFANLLRLVGLPLSDVFRANKIKLDVRYPNGRDKNYKLNIRDKDGEKNLIKKLLEESGAYDTYNKNNKLKK